MAVPDLIEAAAGLANTLATEVGLARATLDAARADVVRAEQLRADAEGYRAQALEMITLASKLKK